MQAFIVACIFGLLSGALITIAAARKVAAHYPKWGWLLAILIFVISAFLIFFICGLMLDNFGDFER